MRKLDVRRLGIGLLRWVAVIGVLIGVVGLIIGITRLLLMIGVSKDYVGFIAVLLSGLAGVAGIALVNRLHRLFLDKVDRSE